MSSRMVLSVTLSFSAHSFTVYTGSTGIHKNASAGILFIWFTRKKGGVFYDLPLRLLLLLDHGLPNLCQVGEGLEELMVPGRDDLLHCLLW